MSDIKPRVDSSGVGWCDPGCPQANGYACRIDNAVRWHNGGLDDDACPHHARRVAAERDRLRAQLAEARKDLFARQNGWIKLCAAIARMPAVVECSRHRNGLIEIDIDYIRQRLIDTWKQIEADLERAARDAAREVK